MDVANEIKVSVVIPVKNGGGTLARCLESICQQTIGSQVEIIVLDSSSTDDSLAIANRYGAFVQLVEAGTFNHGLTRNAGVKLAKGDFIFFTVQDAFFSTPEVLAKMVEHFLNKEVMGVVGHQAVPHERDKNPLLWHRRYTEPVAVARRLSQGTVYEELSQKEKMTLIAWDNVVAMYRRSALMELPFAKTDFAEDWVWSKSALERGWTLVYDPSVVMYHYHHMSFTYMYQVTFTIHYHFYKHFSFLPTVSLHAKRNLQILYYLLKRKQLSGGEKCYWFLYNLVANAAETLSTVNFYIFWFIGKSAGINYGYNIWCKKVPQGKQKQVQVPECKSENGSVI